MSVKSEVIPPLFEFGANVTSLGKMTSVREVTLKCSLSPKM
jgi:hypothetical protein